MSYFALFDQYRINWVKVEIESLYPSSSSGAAGALAKPYSDLYLAPDYDSAATPITQQSVAGRQGVRMVQMTDTRSKTSIVVHPKPAISVELSTGGVLSNETYALGKTGQWLNCGGQGEFVSHYGLKLWYTNWMNTQSSAQVSALRFTFTYNLSFKVGLQQC